MSSQDATSSDLANSAAIPMYPCAPSHFDSQVPLDIVVELPDQGKQGGGFVKPTTLRIFGLEGIEEGGKSFTLTEATPGKWIAEATIEIPPGIEEIDCIAASKDGETIETFHLKCLKHSEGGSDAKQSEGYGAQSSSRISWQMVDMAGASNTGGGDLPSTHEPFEISKHLYARYKSSGHLSIISQAISTLQMAIDSAPAGSSDLAAMLDHLGVYHNERFGTTGDMDDVIKAISVQTQAVHLTLEGHADLPSRLNNLGNSLMCRFGRTGDLGDIGEAISVQSRAVDCTPEDHARLPSRLSNLGSSFMCRFERSNDPQDLLGAISSLTKAVDLAPEGDVDLAAMLSNLGNCLLRCFERTGELQGIDGAIAYLQGFCNLGASLECRFKRVGNVQDVTSSITIQKGAVQLTPDGHAELPARLTSLGKALVLRYGCTGDIQDVAESILVHTRAVGLTPVGHADLPSRLINLGNSLMSRFGRTRSLEDVTEAISTHNKAVRLTPDDHPSLPNRLNSVGTSFRARFECTDDIQDIEDAISTGLRAVYLTPQGHIRLPAQYYNLGNSFLARFKRTNNIPDLAKAIAALGRAVRLTPEGHTDLPTMLSGFGLSLLCRFEHAGDPQHIAQALSVQTLALRLTPDGHADLPSRLYTLASTWLQRYSSTSLPAHLHESISYYARGASCTSGSPRSRLMGAEQWAGLLYKYRPHSTDALAAYDTAIRLLALVAGLEQTVQRRYDWIREYSGLPLEAAAAAFRLERPEKALEWLEQGRCLVWGQQSQLRTPLEELRAHNAALAERVTIVSRQLETAGSFSGAQTGNVGIFDKISLEDEARIHVRLAKEWEDLVKEVRAIDGFEAFLQPPPFGTLLKDLPESGPVVIINVHDDRCDAVALLAGLEEPLHIPLPNFTLKKAKRYQRLLNTQLKHHNLRTGEDTKDVDDEDGEDVNSILKGLWINLVNPILGMLGFQERRNKLSPETLPRVWWCPTGPLSFLPLHAAGIYQGLEVESVMDYAVSSYTPAASALTNRVRGNHLIDEHISGLFLTSQPDAPGVPSIPGTTKEVTSIHEHAVAHDIRVLKLEGDAVTIEGCLGHMEQYSSIHLACHATQDHHDPLRSRFRFHKGNLKLSEVMQRSLKNADLAFLSACETGTGAETLSDEAVHLAAGMLAAGYQRVVATMWEIGDGYAPQVADYFYQYLWAHRGKGSGTTFDGTLSAHALHHATRNLQGRLDNSDSSLLAWIPYVHFGY
ncbi:hypothetical protein FA13DRAFT_1788289 [Coprinellus micaceus]|uniref:CHAT domain-containing protein n=1 Tax=Coprinellus micaceus TaxID=71717 RepID=A0A4Y7TNA4_COPMI|nr:hypothetical protein FA13DRAFT_1788289 [Coprinellus micaceus]